jgi:hypothetical protein
LGSFGIFGERATRDDRDYSESDVASGPSSFRQGQMAGMRGSDVMGNIGEMFCQRDVNGRVAGLSLHGRCLGDKGSGSERVCGISETGLERRGRLSLLKKDAEKTFRPHREMKNRSGFGVGCVD